MKLQLMDLIKYCSDRLFVGNGMKGTMLRVAEANRVAGGYFLILKRDDNPEVRLPPQEVEINEAGEVSVVEHRTQQFVHLRWRMDGELGPLTVPATQEFLEEQITQGQADEVRTS